MFSARAVIVGVAAVLILLIFLISSSSSSSDSSSPPPPPPAATTASREHHSSAASSSPSSITAKTRLSHHRRRRARIKLSNRPPRVRWQPTSCMNFFESSTSLAYVRRAVNWSTPVRPFYRGAFNRTESDRHYPCSYWHTGVWAIGSNVVSSAASTYFSRGAGFSDEFFRIVAESQVEPYCRAVLSAPRARQDSNNNNNNNDNNHQEENQRHGEDKETREEDCSIGICFAMSVASLLRQQRPRYSHHGNSGSRVPFLLLIGDSRVRNMFQRFIMMVRSNQRSSSEEMMRRGVVDNYFHLNATYIVTDAGDEIRILPIGVGCDDEEHVLSFVRGNNDEGTRRAKSVVLLVVCFTWNHRTTWEHHTRYDVDVARYLDSADPDSVVWMPTLHDCVKGRCDNNDAFVGNISSFSRVLIRGGSNSNFGGGDTASLSAQQQQQQQRRHRKVILLTTPTAVWAKQAPVLFRNSVLRQETEKVGDPTRVRLVDVHGWLFKRRPVRCDRVHTMCNFRPMIGHGRVTHFRAVCRGCTDAPDFCFWQQIREALL